MNKNEFIYITKESDSIYKITGTKTMKKYLKDYVIEFWECKNHY